MDQARDRMGTLWFKDVVPNIIKRQRNKTERGKSPVNDLNTILNGLAAIVTIIGAIVGAITFFSKFIKKRPETPTILTGSHPSTRQIEPKLKNSQKSTIV